VSFAKNIKAPSDSFLDVKRQKNHEDGGGSEKSPNNKEKHLGRFSKIDPFLKTQFFRRKTN
jgi:hypothetical protein